MARIPTPKAVTIITTEWVIILTASAVIAASLYLRIKIQGRRLQVSDYFLCLAWCSAVATAPFDIQFAVMGALHQNVKANLDGYNGSADDIELVLKLFWASTVPFFTTFYLCKGALLAVYVNIFPVFMHYRRMLLWATIVYCVLAFVTSIILFFTICLPISANWSITGGAAATCSATATVMVFQVAWALHFFADITIFCLPWLILPDLKVRRALKIGVYCTFGLGIINIVFSLTRFITLKLLPIQELPLGLVELWSGLDVNIGLLVASLPSLRPYFRSKRGTGYASKMNEYKKESSIKTPMGITQMSTFDMAVPISPNHIVDQEHIAASSSRTKSQMSDVETEG
ncbi:hypothetical protein LY78DRAFT_658534 [Colletotrichum sublineola]|nr:hypothetical protein LY78DRAFT_658534 [Colletotrichum sublineola]